MNDRPSEDLIPLVRRLATLLASEDGVAVTALLQKLSAFSRPPARPTPPASRTSTALGVWDADGTGAFVRRPAAKEEWRCWADVERIPPKGRSPRVVMLGESVARGYFYDPILTPALVLEQLLRREAGLGDAEVIDLARIDLTPKGLMALLPNVPLLEPDAIVLFAGNNWHTVESMTPLDFERFHDLIGDGYGEARRRFVDALLPAAAASTLEAIAQLAAACGSARGRAPLPVTVIVPEFNLADWRAESTMLAPVLPDGKNRPWIAALAAAEHALEHGAVAEAERLARQMIALDGGTSARSQTILATSLLRRGAKDEARLAFEAARDAPCGLAVGASPRCPRSVQDVMRQRSQELGFDTVDLPRIFREHLAGDLPDRRLFLDYCHLTRAGIELTMSHVAPLVVAGIRPDRTVPAPMGRDAACYPIRAEDEAFAHVLAAVHNAHYGQERDILLHHARTALAKSAGSADTMQAYLDFAARKAPRWMCSSFVRICDAPQAERYLAFADPNGDDKFADFALQEAFLSAIADEDARARALARWTHEHGGDGELDLLASAYSRAHKWIKDGYDRDLPRAYQRAFGQRSTFFLPHATRGAVDLRITWRVPNAGADRPAVLELNGAPIAELEPRQTWTTRVFSLTPHRLPIGIHRIEIAWPVSGIDWTEHRRAQSARLERGARPEVLPVFGELFALSVQRTARKESPHGDG